MFRTLVRRLFKAALVGGLGFVATSWFRGRETQAPDALPPGKAEWPPLDVDSAKPPVARPDAVADTPAIEEPSDGSAAPPPPGQWVEPSETGDCPVSHPVKVKLRSGIYHTPNGASYDRTNADRCYEDPAAAESDGYRASKT